MNHGGQQQPQNTPTERCIKKNLGELHLINTEGANMNHGGKQQPQDTPTERCIKKTDIHLTYT